MRKQNNIIIDDFEIRKRKGIIVLQRDELMDCKASLLKCIFEVFYPLAIVQEHNMNFYDSLKYYGISPLFEKVDEGVIENEYLVEVKELENGEFELVGFTKK